MKVLLLITKGEIGGAQIFIANLAKGLKNYKNSITIPTVVCGEGDFLFNFCQKENIDFHRLKSLKLDYFLSIDFIKYLHKKMLCNAWSWAGKFR